MHIHKQAALVGASRSPFLCPAQFVGWTWKNNCTPRSHTPNGKAEAQLAPCTKPNGSFVFWEAASQPHKPTTVKATKAHQLLTLTLTTQGKPTKRVRKCESEHDTTSDGYPSTKREFSCTALKASSERKYFLVGWESVTRVCIEERSERVQVLYESRFVGGSRVGEEAPGRISFVPSLLTQRYSLRQPAYSTLAAFSLPLCASWER